MRVGIGWETHGKGKNLVLIANRDPSLFQAKSKSLDLSNRCLHRLGGGLLESEEFAAEREACRKACGTVHTFQNEPNRTWIV